MILTKEYLGEVAGVEIKLLKSYK